jgi:acyl-CoA thioester hydrolase
MTEFNDCKPLELATLTVLPEWIDYNGHMNVSCYVLAFDQGVDAFMELIGISPADIEQRQTSTFTLEMHVNFLHELRLGDPLRLNCQLLDFDSKRVHYFLHMYHAEDGYLAAVSEQIMVHVDLKTRRSSEFPDDVRLALTSLMSAHHDLPRPEQSGSVIGIRRG